MPHFRKNGKNDIIACGALYIDEELEITEDTLGFGGEYIIQKRKKKIGGSVINFSLECINNGLSVSIIGCVGDDDFGNKIINELKTNKINTKHIHVKPKLKTGHSLCILNDKKESVMITDIGANQYLDVSEFLSTQNINATILYLGGVFKMRCLFKSYIKLVRTAKENDVNVSVDHGRFFAGVTSDQISILKEILKISDFYFPNKREILEFTNTETLDQATDKIIKDFPNLIVAIKLGPEGCRVIKGGNFLDVPAAHCSGIITTVGAGDAFNAGFLSKYAIAGLSLEEAAKFANQVAANRICATNPNKLGYN